MVKYHIYEKKMPNGQAWRTDTPPIKKSLILVSKIAGALFFIMGGVCILGGIFSDGDSEFMIMMLLFGVFFIGFGFLETLCYRPSMKKWEVFCAEMRKRDEDYYAAHPFYEDEEFFRSCRKEKVNFNTKEGKARILLLAKNSNITGTEEEIFEKYHNGKKIVEEAEKQIQQQKAAKENAAALKKQTEQYNLTKRYIDMHGTKKRITMALEEIPPLKKILAQLNTQADSISKTYDRTTRSNEVSWATLGGIAAGIAGPAAGLAVAMDVQARNAENRAKNAEVLNSTKGLLTSIHLENFRQQQDIEKRIELWQNIASEAKNKLVEDINGEKLIKELNPQVAKIQILSTENVELLVGVNKKKIKIFDTVEAVIDGAFKANLLVNGEVVGTAFLTLPYCGSENTVTLKTIFVNITKKSDRYDVEFEPYNLFAIETI